MHMMKRTHQFSGCTSVYLVYIHVVKQSGQPSISTLCILQTWKGHHENECSSRACPCSQSSLWRRMTPVNVHSSRGSPKAWGELASHPDLHFPVMETPSPENPVLVLSRAAWGTGPCGERESNLLALGLQFSVSLLPWAATTLQVDSRDLPEFFSRAVCCLPSCRQRWAISLMSLSQFQQWIEKPERRLTRI